MNWFLFILFLIISITGLIYKVDTGVFVGLGLLPWQVIRFRVSKNLNLVTIILTTIAGTVFFLYMDNWVLLVLFLIIELYNYWGHRNTPIRKNGEKEEKIT